MLTGKQHTNLRLEDGISMLLIDSIARLMSTTGNSVRYYNDFAHTPQMSSNHIFFNVCIVGLAMAIKSNSLTLHNRITKC